MRASFTAGLTGEPHRATARIGATLPRVNPALLGWFRWYSRGYLRRHFHALRVRMEHLQPLDPATPVVVYLNHASWWDPLTCLLLREAITPGRSQYAPIEGRALARYPFLGRLGLFGVDRGSLAGTRRFLRMTDAVLRKPGTSLWITPQGRFADPRERPLCLEPGIGQLALRHPEAWFIPVAMEYPFLTERLPAALVRVGRPIAGERVVQDGGGTLLLATTLQETQERLASDIVRREFAGYRNVVEGRTGVGLVYDLWRRARARLQGSRFVGSHQEATS